VPTTKNFAFKNHTKIFLCDENHLYGIVLVDLIQNVALKTRYVTEFVKTGLITHDRKFDFITQTQSLMNVLSNITATDSQSKGIYFF